MAAIEHTYRYPAPSVLRSRDDRLQLALAASADDAGESIFFAGDLRAPHISAQCLRTVADVVATRYYVPPSMLARILREADPVATVADGQLRFEGFSACCSTYVRHDMAPDSFAATQLRPGTTNVDFRADMRAALARIRDGKPMQLSVSADAVTLMSNAESVIERKVPLPIRWIKGFAEVQAHLTGMQRRFSLQRVPTQRFLRSLPRGKADHAQWIVPVGSSVRLSVREAPGSVMVRGTHRLRLLEKLAPLASRLDAWFNASLKSSAWVLHFGGQRLTIVLNTEPWRGFSGDGALLADLATQDNPAVAAVKAQLNWQPALKIDPLANATGHEASVVKTALHVLAAQGLIGYDIYEEHYFHRVLPFDLSLLDSLNPRLASATGLADGGHVDIEKSAAGITAKVKSADVTHQVSLQGDQATCTCPWYAKHKNSRGPCKHILATEMVAERGL